MAVPIDQKTKAFMYRQDSTGMSSDTNKPSAIPYMVGADLPEVDIGPYTYTPDVTAKQGFAMRIPHDIIREEPAGLAEIKRAYDTAGFWLAEIVNTAAVTAMKSGAGSTSTFSPSAEWSATGANPRIDLLALKKDMKRAGYPYRLRHVYIHDDNMYELLKYLTEMDMPMDKMRDVYGAPTDSMETVVIPTIGVVHGVSSGISEGAILGLDDAIPGTEMRYFNDPAFTIPEIRYKTIIEGKEVPQVAINRGIHYNVYVEPDTHDTVMQWWWEGKFVVTQPYALIYASSGI
jgi:hypothetical protein